jgi:hypothetical protein
MTKNEGTVDRIIRAVVGIAALLGAVAIGVGSVGGVLLLVVGAILVVTAAVGFCPLYRVLGLNTCPVKK